RLSAIAMRRPDVPAPVALWYAGSSMCVGPAPRSYRSTTISSGPGTTQRSLLLTCLYVRAREAIGRRGGCDDSRLRCLAGAAGGGAGAAHYGIARSLSSDSLRPSWPPVHIDETPDDAPCGAR